MQRGHAQVRTGSISEISALYRRFENERIKEQRSKITVSILSKDTIPRKIDKKGNKKLQIYGEVKKWATFL
jgi:hypothetical protein